MTYYCTGTRGLSLFEDESLDEIVWELDTTLEETFWDVADMIVCKLARHGLVLLAFRSFTLTRSIVERSRTTVFSTCPVRKRGRACFAPVYVSSRW